MNYDFRIEYKRGKANIIYDALSRKDGKVATLALVSFLTYFLARGTKIELLGVIRGLVHYFRLNSWKKGSKRVLSLARLVVKEREISYCTNFYFLSLDPTSHTF